MGRVKCGAIGAQQQVLREAKGKGQAAPEDDSGQRGNADLRGGEHLVVGAGGSLFGVVDVGETKEITQQVEAGWS